MLLKVEERPAYSAPSISKIKLLVGGSVAALAMAAAPSHAQIVNNHPGVNVQAAATYDSAAINFNPTAPEDIVTVIGTEGIVDWTTNVAGASGTEVSFLPATNNLRFTSDNANFTVLNRIRTPGFDSAIRIDGNVRSDFSGTGATNGNVWFYSPGGIVLGAGSVFDVGGLALTTNDIDTTGGLFGGSGEIRFRGAAGSQSAISVEAGAQINALTSSSYVAMVAPRIVQDGTVTVDGSAAYVAAEQADLTISNGLFDISIPVGSGTTDANGIVHSGTTTGPASTSSTTDAQAIYMVAVPKNDALTMLVGGNIGYQPATTAGVVNGSIVLAAGYADVEVDNSTGQPKAQVNLTSAGAVSSNIELQAAQIDSNAAILANDKVTAVISGAESILTGTDVNGGYDLSITAQNSIDFGVLTGGEIDISGDVTLTAGTGTQGGTINIVAEGAPPVMGPAGQCFGGRQSQCRCQL